MATLAFAFQSPHAGTNTALKKGTIEWHAVILVEPIVETCIVTRLQDAVRAIVVWLILLAVVCFQKEYMNT